MRFVLMPLFALLAGAAAGVAWPESASAARRAAERSIRGATGRPPERLPMPPFALPLRDRLEPWWGLAAARGGFLIRCAWGAALLAVAVAAAALSGRLAIAAGDRVPSPALARLCKGGAALGLTAVALFTGLPVALPLPLAPLVLLGSVLLLGGYLANLPDRL